ncbi:MAG TPA: hypothetical protein VM537_32510 [Anaerolineae bacterium]|nr:hypothetical protein [Anaerolineae bacterium]
MTLDERAAEVAKQLRQVARGCAAGVARAQVVGERGQLGIRIAFVVELGGQEGLVLSSRASTRPPQQRTVHRWCAAFWGDWRGVECVTVGSSVTCRPAKEAEQP